jgi:hypothetical protein
LNFTVSILVPRSSIYAKNSVIEARAKVMLGSQPVKNADVFFIFNNNTVQMSYDSFGEYVVNIGPLSEGEYSVKVTATKENLIAEDKSVFLISGHYLNITEISPINGQELKMKKGEALKIKAKVVDETGDIIYGAFVVAKIVEPDEKALEMQLFQEDKYYAAVLYLDRLDGTYKLELSASHPQFVPAEKKSHFILEFKKEKWMLFGYEFTFETILTVILGIAILILLLGLLRAVF